MNDTPERLNDIITENGAEALEKEFSEFGKNAKISADAQERILASVMRKAGHGMSKNITVKRTRKHNKHFMKIAVAAAVLATGAIAAGAYSHRVMTHKEKVSIYYTEEGAQKLENEGIVNGYTVENGQIRLTVDTEMCDGNFVQGVYTLTALTEEAKEHLATGTTRFVYGDTGEEIGTTGGAFEGWVSDAVSEYEITRSFTYPIKNAYIDSSRPLRLEFFEFVPNGETNEYGDQVVVEDYTFYDGIYFDLLTEANVPSKILCSADGTELTLTPYGLSEQTDNWSYPEDGHEDMISISSVVIIAADGNRYDIHADENGIREYTGVPGSGNFTYNWGRILDVENITGVEINGTAYMEK